MDLKESITSIYVKPLPLPPKIQELKKQVWQQLIAKILAY
jgi:hypothetical protein